MSIQQRVDVSTFHIEDITHTGAISRFYVNATLTNKAGVYVVDVSTHSGVEHAMGYGVTCGNPHDLAAAGHALIAAADALRRVQASQ